ncbi:MAG TPA: hypothetical protein VFO77_07885 [Actinoplanes sp.]|nr:hypothetical protein [Actinoplanes sp.]
MSDFMGPDLFKRVERYEAAVDELRASHEDIKDVLAEHVLYERWKLLGADLGFSAAPLGDRRPLRGNRDLVSAGDMPSMSDAWQS